MRAINFGSIFIDSSVQRAVQRLYFFSFPFPSLLDHLIFSIIVSMVSSSGTVRRYRQAIPLSPCFLSPIRVRGTRAGRKESSLEEFMIKRADVTARQDYVNTARYRART